MPIKGYPSKHTSCPVKAPLGKTYAVTPRHLASPRKLAAACSFSHRALCPNGQPLLRWIPMVMGCFTFSVKCIRSSTHKAPALIPGRIVCTIIETYMLLLQPNEASSEHSQLLSTISLGCPSTWNLTWLSSQQPTRCYNSLCTSLTMVGSSAMASLIPSAFFLKHLNFSGNSCSAGNQCLCTDVYVAPLVMTGKSDTCLEMHEPLHGQHHMTLVLSNALHTSLFSVYSLG